MGVHNGDPFARDPYPEEYYTVKALYLENLYLKNKLECERLKGWLIKNGYSVPDEPAEFCEPESKLFKWRSFLVTSLILTGIYYTTPELLSREFLRMFLLYGLLIAVFITFANIYLSGLISHITHNQKVLMLFLKYFHAMQYILANFFGLYFLVLIYYFARF